jgi:hypothetical protein
MRTDQRSDKEKVTNFLIIVILVYASYVQNLIAPACGIKDEKYCKPPYKFHATFFKVCFSTALFKVPGEMQI